MNEPTIICFGKGKDPLTNEVVKAETILKQAGVSQLIIKEVNSTNTVENLIESLGIINDLVKKKSTHVDCYVVMVKHAMERALYTHKYVRK